MTSFVFRVNILLSVLKNQDLRKKHIKKWKVTGTGQCESLLNTPDHRNMHTTYMSTAQILVLLKKKDMYKIHTWNVSHWWIQRLYSNSKSYSQYNLLFFFYHLSLHCCITILSWLEHTALLFFFSKLKHAKLCFHTNSLFY